MRTGSYVTTSHNSVYGMLSSQITVGESYNKIWDVTANEGAGGYVEKTVGSYNTYVNVNGIGRVDEFGTVRESVTIGESRKLDEKGDWMRTGLYTTTSRNNVYGILTSQLTVGVSYNKIWDGAKYVEYTVGTYNTSATDIDGFGTVRNTATAGQSVRLDDAGGHGRG